MTLRMTAALLCLLPLASAELAAASYVQRDEVRSFVREMEEKHGFDGGELLSVLDRAQHDERVISLITPSGSPGVRSWQRYRSRFLDETRIRGGLEFWQQHEPTLQAASERYGVPPEIIVAIIGVETVYGRNTGSFETVSALATLAFDYPPRAALFRRELENLFLLAREQGRDPSSYHGSYAGALGYPQFLPSSIRSYAIDFDGNGQIDFDADPADAIGSVANYLALHGWQRDGPVAIPAYVPPGSDPASLVAAGIEPTLAPETLAEAGIGAAGGDAPAALATLVDLVTPGLGIEYWLGYRNFYVITRYNKSSFYAMAVRELAQELRAHQREAFAGSP